MNKTKLDRVFSEFIRLRDADINGMVKCISCTRMIHWNEADAGHYINRKHMSTRWDEHNVNGQCRACNRFDEGNIPMYHLGLQRKYDVDTPLKLLAKKNSTVKIGQFEIDCLTKHYKQEVKKLKKNLQIK